VYVLEVDGKVAGVVDVVEEDDYLLVDMLAKNSLVHAERVGSRLLEFAEDLARRKGKERVRIEALDGAVDFYAKLGYKVISFKFND
jgi:predicted N-acetyltransferase YhbS